MGGKWITIEGIGGSGKSTQVQMLEKYFLNSKGLEVILTKEPGGTNLGVELRKILVKDLEMKPEYLSELFLFEADRHETVKKIVEPNVSKGNIVISDRGIDGSIAYQGFGRGLPIPLINNLTALATDNRQPDLTILVDIDPIIAQERITKRGGDEFDKFDLEEHKFQEKVREGFLYSARINTNRVKIVDGSNSTDKIHQDIINIIEESI
ncbi:dTMP kinase [Virgibacillus halodenitrificans]|uniref:dTMP kinase n=1 Tax=Virgibacillus halodenitrificans TaxID=1482 RepID=UPI0024C04CF3|nr:dTMP kinase [Virgibacillus halodenitrificans]WHX25112.1 dTMP kinase [Virgibacillus halodenitrificans]